MKAKENKAQTMVTIPTSLLLSLVATKLRGRVLFPKKVESARKYLENVKTISF
jgi:hypothetical protein